MNQASRATAAQSNTRMFGYLEQAATSASFQFCMSDSEYGPLLTKDFALTHSTGCLPITDIIRSILVDSDIVEPTYTSAASLVLRAITQQPRYPLAMRRRATS